MELQRITVRLPDQVLTALDAHIEASSKGDVKLTYSTVVRDALIQYLHLDYVDDISVGGRRPGAGRRSKE